MRENRIRKNGLDYELQKYLQQKDYLKRIHEHP